MFSPWEAESHTSPSPATKPKINIPHLVDTSCLISSCEKAALQLQLDAPSVVERWIIALSNMVARHCSTIKRIRGVFCWLKAMKHTVWWRLAAKRRHFSSLTAVEKHLGHLSMVESRLGSHTDTWFCEGCQRGEVMTMMALAERGEGAQRTIRWRDGRRSC